VILAGDIGGTKTNVALLRFRGGAPKALRRATYRSGEFPGLAPILTDFLGDDEAKDVTGACFGIAGPVSGNRVRTPNLPWEVDGDALARAEGLPFLTLINDLEATAEGIPLLGPEDFTDLNPAAGARPGSAALIAAGTGLGMALIPRVAGEPVSLPSEGGHASFAPRDEEGIGLLRFLQKRLGRVSVERVVSGPGLVNVYEYFRDAGADPEIPQVAERMAAGDPAAAIAEAAASGECPLSQRSLDFFIDAYGAAAGDLALVTLARGGLYVGGGIAPKLLPRIAEGRFLDGFLDKGRFRPLLERIPVRLIENPETAVLGAARRAARQAG